MKKSRILSAFLALVLCIGIFPLQTVAAEAPASDFEYWEDYDGIIIEDYIGSSKSVVIPSKIDGMNVVSIESEAFYGTGVTSITIPVTLKYIKYGDGGSYFSCNTLQSVTVNAANTAFSSVNGVLFNKVKTCLYQYPSMKSGSSYTVPNTVTKIGSFAFYRVPNLVSITLPSSLKAIDWLAISSCTKLKSLAIPDQVKSLDYATIGTCPALTSVSIGSGATYIDANAFYDCASLSAININSANKNYSSSSGVLFNKAKTSLIKYPVKKAGTSYSIPSSVNYILYGAFKDCSALNLSFPNKKLNIARNALHDTKWFSGQQNGVVYAAKNAYSYKGTMPKDYALTLKSDTVYVTEGAFSRQGNLKSVVIPDSVTGLADEAFYNSYRLSSVKLGKSVANIGNSTFANTAITGLAIPASVRTIGDYAFGSCEQLKTLTIAPGVTSIGEAAFVNSGLTSVKLPYTLTEIKMETFNSYDDTLKSVTIPATVTSISYFAFPSVKNLTINGYKNTPAETFAKDYGAKFVALTPVTVTGIQLNTSSNKGEMGIGESKQLGVKFSPADATYRKISWKSSNGAVASVSATGLVKANATGTAKITASSTNGKTATYSVTVKKAPSSVALNYSKATIGVGEKTLDLNSTVNSGAASNKRSFTTSNSAVATVDANGVVTGKKVGTATITVTTYNGRTAKCVVTVRSAPSSITLNETSATIGVGDKTLDLNSAVNSGAGSLLRKYSSSNTAVATVAQSGVVTGKKVGTAVITVTTYNGRKTTCTVTVKNAPSSITLNYKSKTLSKGGKVDLNSSVNSGAGAFLRKYSSNNTKVATVDVNGIVTAKAVGKATITVKTFNGRSATCLITVK